MPPYTSKDLRGLLASKQRTHTLCSVHTHMYALHLAWSHGKEFWRVDTAVKNDTVPVSVMLVCTPHAHRTKPAYNRLTLRRMH